jgi:hypothetical protein
MGVVAAITARFTQLLVTVALPTEPVLTESVGHLRFVAVATGSDEVG